MIQLTEPIMLLDQRALTEDDVAALAASRGTLGTTAPHVKRLTQRHHRLARLLAEGIPPGEAAILTDYDPSRVSILQADPAFAELITHYATRVDAAYASLHDKLSDLATTAAAQLQDRLEDGEDLEVDELMSIIKLGADRTGHGPSTTTKHEVGDNLASRMLAAQARYRLAKSDDVIEGEIVPPKSL